MAFTWKKSFELGHPLIDAQHKQLVDTFNDLMDACLSGEGRDKLESTLDFLCEYTIKHFNDEEEWQCSINYPEYQNHRQIHEDFKELVTKLMAEFKKGGPTDIVVAELNCAVGEWLVNHIKMDDAKIASFYLQEKYGRGQD